MPTTNSNQNDRLYGVLSYIWILWIIPLVAAPKSKFARFHANQGLVLFLFSVVYGIVGSVVPFVGWFLIIPICALIHLVLAIMGIVNAASGQQKPLPLLGGITLLK